MRPRHATFIVSLMMLLISAAAFAQTPERKVGLSASLQGSQFDILVPIWMSHTFSIAPGFGFTTLQGGGSDLRIALIPRIFTSRGHLSPYVGGRMAALFAMPDYGPATTDLLAGISVGGEYFLDDQFSFGVEAQFNLTHSDDRSTRFGAPGKWLANTASAVFATVYF